MQIFNHKTALITGASRGIGPFIARKLAGKGCKVIAVARNEEKLSELCDGINNSGGDATYKVIDLSRISSIEDQIDTIVEGGVRIDFLINNAGIEQYSRLQNFPAEVISRIIETNLHAPIELTRILLPYMLENGGSIVNIASLAGKKGVAYNSIYSATKSGLIMWSDAMRQELKETPVNISVICPGYIGEAGMFADSNMSAPKFLGESSPEDVANAVIRSIQKNIPEVIVNKGPMKPLLGLGQLSPGLGDRIVRLLGIPEMNRKRAVEEEKRF